MLNVGSSDKFVTCLSQISHVPVEPVDGRYGRFFMGDYGLRPSPAVPFWDALQALTGRVLSRKNRPLNPSLRVRRAALGRRRPGLLLATL